MEEEERVGERDGEGGEVGSRFSKERRGGKKRIFGEEVEER